MEIHDVMLLFLAAVLTTATGMQAYFLCDFILRYVIKRLQYIITARPQNTRRECKIHYQTVFPEGLTLFYGS